MAMQWKYSNGYDTSEFCTALEIEDDYALGEYEKDLILKAESTADSKSIQLGLADNQPMIIANVGASIAFTAKNLKNDSGQSIAAGKVALVLGSTTANGTKFYVLN